MKRVRYGQQIAEESSAQGVTGSLCSSFIGGAMRYFLRVPTADPEGFTDYDFRHDDLTVTIAADELVSFYKLENGDHVLGHSSAVLGLQVLR